MTQKVQLYVFKPGRVVPPGRAGNKASMTKIAVRRSDYDALFALCDADYVVRKIAREASLALAVPAPGCSWTDTVLAATFEAARKHDAEMRAWAAANNAGHAESA